MTTLANQTPDVIESDEVSGSRLKNTSVAQRLPDHMDVPKTLDGTLSKGDPTVGDIGGNLSTQPFEPGSSAFGSLVFPKLPENIEPGGCRDLDVASDLNLDQILAAMVSGQEERDLIVALFYQGNRDPNTIRYRHEVFKDLEDRVLYEQVQRFARLMQQVRSHLVQKEKMVVHYQRQGWFLDAAALYCEAVSCLNDGLNGGAIKSRGLVMFRAFLADYVASPQFASLVADTERCKQALEHIQYCIRIRGRRVDVSRYDGEVDYSAEVSSIFARFKQGAVKDYRVAYRTWPGMNYVGSQILELVARLFSQEFLALDKYCERHADFLNKTVRRFERELQFYLTYLNCIESVRSAGLSFCYPEVTASHKDILAVDTFDLALARKLTAQGMSVVCNDFRMDGSERIVVVSGPNQGGKTTFARAFGQLHHLASVGYPVPGKVARLFLSDRILAHFEREEDLSRMRGQLEDDIIRVREILQLATSDSIIIMNESFASTTTRDALFLGKKVMEKVIALDLLCVYVTFIDELAALGPSVVSMVSTVVPENPTERTYKVIRAPADGLAYAMAIAEKYHLTYEHLRRRIIR